MRDDVCVCSRVLVFFFKVSATTDIYTYVSTLALHDGLPIYDDVRPECAAILAHPPAFVLEAAVFARSPQLVIGPAFVDPALRSEEHTPEHQSLMRISYAVSCLKKQKLKPTVHITEEKHHQDRMTPTPHLHQ